jgi:hypothetical protein
MQMKRRAGRLLRPVSLVALALFGAACGRPSGPLGAGSAGGGASSTPRPSASPSPNASASPERVTLTLNKQQYATQDPLLVTIHNDLDMTIWARDMHSGCSVIVVERLNQGAWQPLEPCARGRRPQIIPTPAGSTLVQRIDFAQGVALDSGDGWPAGTYRAALTYALSQDAAGGETGTTVYSAEFTIQ